MMSRTQALITVGSLAAVAIAWVIWSAPINSEGSNVGVRLRPGNAQVVLLGEKTYLGHCAECHGRDLKGQPNWRQRDAEGYLPAPPHDASGHTWHHTDQLLFDITKYGTAKLVSEDYKTRMPGYEDLLSDQEIIAVLSFIKSRWPEKLQRRHDSINSAKRGH